MPRHLIRLLVLAAWPFALLGSAHPALAAAGTQPVTLTVSTPADPVAAAPGHAVDTWLRVTNASAAPLPVTISPAAVQLADNGATRLTPGSDPRFGGAISIGQQHPVVPAQNFLTVPIRISVPADLAPDTYLLGFLVTPAVSGDSVRVVNQVGGLIALDLPGQRDERLAAAFVSAPHIALTSHPSLTFRVRATGRSAVRFTSEATIGGLGTATPTDIRRAPLLLPAGHYRDTTISWRTRFGLGYHHVHVLVMYHRTPSQTAQLVLTRSVLVLAPGALATLAGLLAVVVVALVAVLRTRRGPADRGGGRHSARERDAPDRSPSPATHRSR